MRDCMIINIYLYTEEMGKNYLFPSGLIFESDTDLTRPSIST